MGERKYTYDSACEGLAAHFLAGQRVSEFALFDLAQHIQSAVEEWFRSREAERMPASDENVPGLS